MAFKRFLWAVAGTTCISLAILGIVLPLLPTTPLLLLGAFCYGRASRRLSEWLEERSPMAGFIREYREHRRMRREHKAWTIAILSLSMTFSIVFLGSPWWLKIALALVWVGVTVHVARIPSDGAVSGEAVELAREPEGTEASGAGL